MSHSTQTPTPPGAGAPPLITADLVALDADLGATKADVIARLAASVVRAGRASSADGLLADALAREEQSATGLPGGIAIPHCRSGAVSTASLAFARLAPAVDFGAPDAGADLVFLIAAPTGGGQQHLKLLASLARALVRKDFTAALRAATTPQEVVDLVSGVVNPAPKAAAGATATGTAANGVASNGSAAAATGATAVSTGAASAVPGSGGAGARRTIVGVTSCPTGIAHTYMAADSLVAAGERAGVDVIIETQGSAGMTPLDPATIAGAIATIFATDVGVRGRERFAGKPVVASGVKRAINEPDVMVAEALRAADDPNAARVAGDAASGAGSAGASGGKGDVSFGVRVRQVLLTGVSYMIPFVAAGGLLIALGFLLAGYGIALTHGDSGLSNADWVLQNYSLSNLPPAGVHHGPLLYFLGAAFFKLGGLAFSFLVPALAGYIAFGIADRPGIAPGFAAGAVAVYVGAGFIGGLVAGILAGLVAYWISQFNVPRWARGLMPVVIIPLFATLISGGLMLLVLGRPLADVTTGLSNWLNGLSGTSAVLLGIILGLMMAFDLGGPVNKAAYAFATAGLAAATPAAYQVMAAVMAAGMVPPLAMALATAVRPKLFSAAERENGKAAWLLGASFISEGAIPFAAADPLRVIPSGMIGAATTGALIMATHTQLRAPHGGIFVLFAINPWYWFIIATVVGMVISGVAIVVAKQFIRRRPAPGTPEAGDAAGVSATAPATSKQAVAA